MITTTMTAQEILREYKADYERDLRPRLSRIATRHTHDLKVAKGKWICLREKLQIRSLSGNTYSLHCKLRWDKHRGVGWKTTTYLETSDTKTGKKVVYLMSDNFPIKLSSSFLREIKTSVSEFLSSGATWDILPGPNQESRYSAYINFGDNLGAGVGGWEDGVFVLRHLQKSWETDPLSEFLKSYRQDTPKEDPSTPKSEIDLAWEAYLNGPSIIT